MDIENIRQRALAAAAEKTQRLEQEETSKKETAVEAEVKSHLDQRAELYGQYQQRLTQIETRKGILAERQASREKDLAQIEQIREQLGLKDSELSKAAQTIAELKQSSLSQEELDPFLQEIATEQERLETERQQLLERVDELESEVKAMDTESTDLVRDEKEANLSPDLAAANQGELSTEAMAKLQEQALAENQELDEQAEAKRQIEFKEKHGAQLRSDTISLIAHMEQAGEDAGTGRDKAFIRGEGERWDLEMPSREVYVDEEKLNDRYLTELQKSIQQEVDLRLSDEYVNHYGKPDESGDYSAEAWGKLGAYKRKLTKSLSKLREVNVATVSGRERVWKNTRYV